MNFNNQKKQKGYGLFESLLTVMIIMALVTGFFYWYMEKQKEIQAIIFGKEMVSVVTAFDKRIHVDGFDVNNFKNGTNWANSTEVLEMLNTEFIARDSSCGNSKGWVPVMTKERNTKLISCKFWNKIPYGFNVKANVNSDTDGFIKNFMIIFEPKSIDAFSKDFRFYNKAKMIASSNDSLSLTGGHDFYFARSTDLLTKITTTECLAAKTDCNLVALYDRQGGNEYLRVDGTNSMLGSVVTFKPSKSNNKLSCVRWEKNNTSSVWSSSIVDCGIGIYNKTNTPVAVEVASDSITSKQLLLDKLCPVFRNSADGFIDTSETAPCGIVPQDDGSGEVAYQIVDTLSAKKGLIKTLYTENIFTDQVNTNYINVKKDLTVLGNSVMGGTLSVAGMAQFDNNINLTKVESVGFYCSPNGLLSRDLKGAVLSCQNSKWTLVGAAASVLTGSITHGKQIPLPEGKTQAKCTFSVSSANNAHPASRPDYAGGNYASVSSSRVVTCGFLDKGSFHAGGSCSYVIACN